MMKKLSVLLLMMMGAVALAQYDPKGTIKDSEGNVFQQVAREQIHTYASKEQPNEVWAQAISVEVKKGQALWITNVFDSLQTNKMVTPPLGLTPAEAAASQNNIMHDYVQAFDMTSGKYGYAFVQFNADGTPATDANGRYLASEAHMVENVISRDITVTTGLNDWGHNWGTDPDFDNRVIDPSYQHTIAYYLGAFDQDGEIFLYMTTPTDKGNYLLDSFTAINPTGYATTNDILGSRQIAEQFTGYNNGLDEFGNPIWNFGLRSDADTNSLSRRFTMIYGPSLEPEPPQPVGQPLPGVLASCLVALSAIVLRKRRSNKR